MAKKKQLIVKSELISHRGWTRLLVERFAGRPDVIKENPHYKKSADMWLFSLAKIKRIEKGAKFKAEKEKSEKRKVSASKAVETKRALTKDWLDHLPMPELPAHTEAELTALAVTSYNLEQAYRDGERQIASLNSDQEFLHRISVNYARHELTYYDYDLMASRGLVGQREARNAIRDKILEAIETAYPWLFSACCRQRARYFQRDMEELNCR